jgi:hypothetical protein
MANLAVPIRPPKESAGGLHRNIYTDSHKYLIPAPSSEYEKPSVFLNAQKANLWA